MWTFYNSSGEAMIIDGGLANVVEDTTPQLGGNLDMGANLQVGNGGSTGIAISANGEVNMAAQPGVLAYNSATDSNVTGNNTAATVDFNTEVFDQNGDFASDTFTAPINGKYLITANIWASGITSSATRIGLRVVTSNVTYDDISGVEEADGGALVKARAIIAEMEASDTASIVLYANGEGSDVIDIIGDGTRATHMSVWLLG